MKGYPYRIHYTVVDNGYMPTERQQNVAKELYRNNVRWKRFPFVEHLEMRFSYSGQSIRVDLIGEGDNLIEPFHGKLTLSPIP